jgi:hypothetical protein
MQYVIGTLQSSKCLSSNKSTFINILSLGLQNPHVERVVFEAYLSIASFDFQSLRSQIHNAY